MTIVIVAVVYVIGIPFAAKRFSRFCVGIIAEDRKPDQMEMACAAFLGLLLSILWPTILIVTLLVKLTMKSLEQVK